MLNDDWKRLSARESMRNPGADTRALAGIAQRACCTKARSAQQERGPLETRLLLHECRIRAARVLHEWAGSTPFATEDRRRRTMLLERVRAFVSGRAINYRIGIQVADA
jgi:hypothetical protein